MKRLPIGISDFKKLIENDYYFVDTSEMIAEIYREAADIALITRPRRFGKTLNMSMLRYFFDNRFETSALFTGLKISEDTEVMKEINGYPTVFLTFKDIKDNSWEMTRENLKALIAELYGEYYGLLKKNLKDFQWNYCHRIINGIGSDVDYQRGLKNLTEFLFEIYKKPVMLIIDEYDVPIQSGWSYGFYDDVIGFMRGFLSGALKDNNCLFKGVLTGIYRVAKESIFSGLNNLSVFTILEKDYSEYFGFTEDEINDIFNHFGSEYDLKMKNDLKSWYNGYKFGDSTIYNPWSVVNYLRFKELKSYWINTSSNDLIITVIEENLHYNSDFRLAIENLISGKNITKTIDNSASLRDLQTKTDSIWSLFLFSGYLKQESYVLKKGKYECKLNIPNEEVLIFFQDTVLSWLEKSGERTLFSIVKPLLNGKAEIFCENLKNYVLNALSYHDLKGEPENTYHMILLGMFAHLTEEYWIKSNRESGLGRYDICLKAKDKQNYSAIIEIKADPEAVKDAMKQIDEKAYLQELTSEGYTRIMKIALGVDGKRIETIAELM